MGIIRDILSQVDAAVDTVAQDGFVSSAASVGNVISAGATLLVVLLGINAVMQLRPLPFGTGFAFGMKVALVGIFAQSWDNFSVIYDIVTRVPDSVGASILALTGSGDEAGVYESLDNMVARITAYGDTIGDRAGWVFGAVLGAIFFVLSAVFAAVRFRGQTNALDVPFGGAGFDATIYDTVIDGFEAAYERLFGRGAGYRQAGFEIVELRVSGTAALAAATATGHGDTPRAHGSRPVVFDDPDAPVDTTIYHVDYPAPDSEVHGPAIIEFPGQSVVVPPGAIARADAYGNLHVTLEARP